MIRTFKGAASKFARKIAFLWNIIAKVLKDKWAKFKTSIKILFARIKVWGIDQLATINEQRAVNTMYKFMKYWAKGKYIKAYRLTQKTYRDSVSFRNFMDQIQKFEIEDFGVLKDAEEIISLKAFRIGIKVIVMANGQPVYIEAYGNAIAEKAPYTPSTFGSFGINPKSVLKSMNLALKERLPGMK